MPGSVTVPSRRVPVELLTPTSFSGFGTVIQNPQGVSGSFPKCPLPVSANQGSAQKYADISLLANFYHLAPSKKPSRPIMNLYSCAPRLTRKDEKPIIVEEPEWSTVYEEKTLFDVTILERHPFTTQTFIPIGQPASDPKTYYLVIVAPTLPPARSSSTDPLLPPYPVDKPRKRRSLTDVFSRARPKLFTNETTPPAKSKPAAAPDMPKGAGLPDLDNLRAFVATGDQAITYGAGVWHAPMVVAGDHSIDFVVIQNTNGVTMEDTQEVEIRAGDGTGIAVELQSPFEVSVPRAKL